jgi:hypothetical protein
VQVANFTMVDHIVSLAIVLHQSTGLEPSVTIDDRRTMSAMVISLFKYLRTDTAAYHARAVNLIWSLEATTINPHVESIIAQTMTSPESRNVHESYEAFGTLWRLTGLF